MGKLVSIEEKKEIEDTQLLLERAKKGISDVELDKVFIKKQKHDKKILEKFDVDSIVTVQKLKERKYEKGITGTNAVTIITRIKEKNNNKDSNKEFTIQSTPPPADSDDLASGDWDGTYGVYNYMTVYYDYRHFIDDTPEEQIWIDVTRITSRWDNQDNYYTIKNGFIRGKAYAHKIINPHSSDWYETLTMLIVDGTESGEYRYISTVSDNTNYSFYPDWDWLNVYPDQAHGGGYAEIEITDTRNDYSWIFTSDGVLVHKSAVPWSN